jgi:hypothetical protein
VSERARRLLILLLITASGGACGVGDGVGVVEGMLYVRDCTPEGDYGSAMVPWGYNMDPDFFVGEPIEDVREGGLENRIVIRVETVGRRVRQSRGIIARGPLKDQLILDIDVFPVARCMRAATLGVVPEDLERFCLVTPGDPKPRVRVGPEQPIRVNFIPRASCPKNSYVIGAAEGDDPRPAGVRVAVDPANWLSYVVWTDFGDASGTNIDQNFKVEFGDRLRVDSFKLHIEDDKRLKAEREERLLPVGEIEGDLTGLFDFDLDRGQGAQTFP